MSFCGNCRRNLKYVTESGSSGLYFPKGFDIELCISCLEEEDRLIEESGTNNHPKRLKHYLNNLNR